MKQGTFFMHVNDVISAAHLLYTMIYSFL